jgi:Carboxypeptidase regulatory-like domain/TonB-dependent Receptor Plug Domain/TonB dependent receptor
MKFSKFVLVLMLGVAAGVLFTSDTQAQTVVTGALSGTVSDPSGSAVADASVTLSSSQTGESYSTTTTSNGVYGFSLVKPGQYSLVVEKAGFRKSRREITSVVGQFQTNNVQLEVGDITETVEVTASQPLLQSENANLSTTFDSDLVQKLPNPGSDLTAVAQTAPGVLMNTSNGGGYGNFTAFGLPATSNLFTVNGNDENDPYLNLNNSGATNLLLGTNEVQEVAVVSNGYTGQYGRQAGAQVDYVTKTGTNKFHGNATYNYNTDAFNANDFFNNASSTPLPKERNNQWAASFGGPIFKDKAFFFVDTEGLRYILGSSNDVVVPTPAFATAVLNNLPSNGFPNSVPFYTNLFNLWANAPGISRAVPVDDAFDGSNNLGCGDLNTELGSGGVVPGFEQFGGVGTNNSAYGGTNVGGGTPCSQHFRSTVGQLSTEWILAGNVDLPKFFSDKDRINVRYRMDRGVQPTYTDPVSPVFNATSNQPQYEGQINWNHIFGNTKTNQFILSGLQYSAIFGTEATAAQSTFSGALYNFDTNGWANIGGENNVFPQGRKVAQAQIVDDFTWNHGAHTIKFGGNYRYNKVSDASNLVRINPRLRIFSTTDFVTGFLDQISQRFPELDTTTIGIYSLGVYAQDEWRVKSNFKLTLALRADRNSNAACYQNCFARLSNSFADVTHDNSIPFNQFFDAGLNHAFKDLEPVVFQPRLGFAWTPNTRLTSGGHTVIRGGAGLFSDLYPATLADNFMHNAPALRTYTVSFAGTPFSPAEGGNAYASETVCDGIFTGVVNSGGTRSDYLTQAAAAGLPCAVPDYNSVQNKIYNPKFIEWNLQIQQQIGAKTVLDVNYVGNHGYDLFVVNPWVNAAPRAAPFTGLPDTRPDRRINNVSDLTNSGESNYHGLTASLTHRFTKGFMGRFNYSYSHTQDDVSNGGILPYSLNDSLLQSLTLTGLKQLNYSNADYDVRHNISANYVWEIPFKSSNHFVNVVASGWLVAGTFFYRSGLPFSVYDSAGSSTLLFNGVNGTLLVDPTTNVSLTCGVSARNESTPCLNANDFTSSNSGTITGFGHTPRNSFRGPGFFTSDFSLLKNFQLGERFRLGLGATAYNVFNHANFANPISDVSSGQFGQIRNTNVPPTSAYGAFVGSAVSGRLIQLNARVTF